MNDKEKQLWDRYKKNGDTTELVEFYYDLMIRCSQKVCNNYKNYRAEELMSYAYEGLMDAIRQYDETKGVPFKNFAGMKIWSDCMNGVAGETKSWRKQMTISLELPVEDGMTLEDLLPCIENSLNDVDFKDELGNITKGLSEKDKKIFAMRLASMTIKEIAKKLKVGEKVLDNRWNRIRKKIRTNMERE
jgi:RNA polymerase sigma factor (sigma-70 family)